MIGISCVDIKDRFFIIKIVYRCGLLTRNSVSCFSSRLTAAPTAPTVALVPQHAPVNLAPSLRALSTMLPESSQGLFQVR